MSTYKFLRFAYPRHPYYDPIIGSKWFQVWHHWLNPFGNKDEPMPFPEHRAQEALDFHKKWKINKHISWFFRNFMHNFFHYWIGLCPVGKFLEWKTPHEGGWEQGRYFWKKRFIYLPRYNGLIGWQQRGNFRMHPVLWMFIIAILMW